MDRVYPKSHVTMIMGLNLLSLLVGLALAVVPFVKHWFPGSIDTTSHVGVGALIVILSAFRMLLAYGATWIDIVLIAFGIIAFRFPAIMHMQWNSNYTMGHMIGGAVVIGVAVVSLLLTVVVRGKMRHA